VFGLRLNDGVDLAGIPARFAGTQGWAELQAELDRLESEDLVERSESVVRLTRAGRLLADAVGSELMGVLSVR
jgi:oxygen-independent coproporphyrinogen-3 oxidase